MISRILKEPLVQFLILGTGLFTAYTFYAPAPQAPRERIVIDTQLVDSLEAKFKSAWKRPPTEKERAGLIEDRIAEEVLYREALKFGLDKNDGIIRNRLRQKMEFLLQDGLAKLPPDDAALQSFHNHNKDRYRSDDKISFEQLFLGENLADDAKERAPDLTAHLNANANADTSEFGATTMLPRQTRAAPSRAVDRVFGNGFAKILTAQSKQLWVGPVKSAFGWHLVRIDAIEPGSYRPLEEVRKQVLRDVQFRQRQDAETALIDQLKKQYEIVYRDSTQ